jgi:type IV secretion system protein VirB10
MRPDGSTIDVDSPTADPLGRAGVKGKVDTHFFERFGGAILQSVLDAGVQLATREAAGDTVVLSLPNNSQTVAARPEDIRPTIKVRQGTSVSVFVGRDLDFTDVEG